MAVCRKSTDLAECPENSANAILVATTQSGREQTLSSKDGITKGRRISYLQFYSMAFYKTRKPVQRHTKKHRWNRDTELGATRDVVDHGRARAYAGKSPAEAEHY